MGWEGLSEEQKKRGGEVSGGWWQWAWQEAPGVITHSWGHLPPGHSGSGAGEGWQQRGRDSSIASWLRLSLLFGEQD